MLTTPVMRCIKQQVPNSVVHYLTKKSFSGIVTSSPYIDKVHVLADDFNTLIAELKAEQFDCIIDLHHNLRTLKVKRALRVKSYAYNKLNLQKWLYTTLRINLMPKVHIVDRYLQTAAALGIQSDGKGLDYFIPGTDEVPDNDIPHAHLLGYIGIVIGAAHNTKKLPVNKMRELCASINHPIILLGGPEDRAAGDEIAAVDDVKIYNACGKFNLNESADLVRKARIIISHDTGLMHIAAAFKKPIISIWGNTVPSFGMTPYYGFANQPSHIMQVNKLYCRPCSKIGYNACPHGHFKCMNKQNISELTSRVDAMLRNK